MHQTLDSQTFTNSPLFRFFQSTAVSHAPASTSYSKALASLGSFLSSLESFIFPSLPVLADWLVYMYRRKLSFKTAVHYLNAVSALWSAAVKNSLAEPSDAFRLAKSRLAAINPPDLPFGTDEFARVKDFTRRLPIIGSDDAVAADILLLSLLTASTQPAAVASLRKDILPSMPAEALEVAARNVSTRRKYIFDLGQSLLTSRQLERKAAAILSSLFRLRNLPQCGSVEQTIGAWWAHAALHAGLSGSEVISILRFTPDAIPHLALCDPAPLSDDRRIGLIDRVARSFIDNPLRWFAMRLRPRVSYQTLCQRLALLSDPAPTLFYPLQEIARKINKKIVFRQKPLIRDVVFFRYRASDIPGLFASIGDLAWCYTVSGRTGAPYAPISDAAFARFQQAIGLFTSQCEEQLADIPKGTDIQVVSGLFQGLQSELDKIENEDGENIFRLLYNSPNGIKWNIGVDARNARIAAPATKA